MIAAVASKRENRRRGPASLEQLVADVADGDDADQAADRHRGGGHRAGERVAVARLSSTYFGPQK